MLIEYLFKVILLLCTKMFKLIYDIIKKDLFIICIQNFRCIASLIILIHAKKIIL
jgi:hypothetical protein